MEPLSSAPSAPACGPPTPPPPPPAIMSNLEHSTDASSLKIANQASTHQTSPSPWSTGFCDCCLDFRSCCLTCWCPCIAFGRIAEIVDRGSTSCGVSGALYTLLLCFTGCSCLYSCFYRSKLRGQFFLEETLCCCDCCVHFCCEQCALCQEYRELNNRGFDLSIGWHGNIERQKRMAPIPQGDMIR